MPGVAHSVIAGVQASDTGAMWGRGDLRRKALVPGALCCQLQALVALLENRPQQAYSSSFPRKAGYPDFT